MRKLLLIALALVAVTGCAPASRQAASGPSSVVVEAGEGGGAEMAPFKLKDVQGRPFDLAEHLGREVIMVSFWATWCSPCKTELSRMADVWERLRGDGFLYVAVSTDGPATLAQVRPYVQSYGYTFPVLLDTQTKVMSRYNPRGDMPFYVLVGSDGRIVETHQGFTPGDEAKIEARVRALLGKTAQ